MRTHSGKARLDCLELCECFIYHTLSFGKLMQLPCRRDLEPVDEINEMRDGENGGLASHFRLLNVSNAMLTCKCP